MTGACPNPQSQACAGYKLPFQALLLTAQSSDLTTDGGTGQSAPCCSFQDRWETTTHRPKDNLTRPITSKEIESLIKNLWTNKGLQPDGFADEFYHFQNN